MYFSDVFSLCLFINKTAFIVNLHFLYGSTNNNNNDVIRIAIVVNYNYY